LKFGKSAFVGFIECILQPTPYYGSSEVELLTMKKNQVWWWLLQC